MKFLLKFFVRNAKGLITQRSDTLQFIVARFSNLETCELLQALMCKVPHTPAGVRFVSLSLCMLLACPYLLG